MFRNYRNKYSESGMLIKKHQKVVKNWNILGFLPTFGPSFVNLYGSIVTETSNDKTTALNEGLVEGSAYKGRLLLSLEMEILDETTMYPLGVNLESCDAIEQVSLSERANCQCLHPIDTSLQQHKSATLNKRAACPTPMTSFGHGSTKCICKHSSEKCCLKVF